MMSDLLFHQYFPKLALAVGIVLLLTIVFLPLAERHLKTYESPCFIRKLWIITMLSILLRLSGTLFPLLEAYDIFINEGRFLKTIVGKFIVTGPSSEFGDGIIVYPPGSYLVLIPGILIGFQTDAVVQNGVSLFDGFNTLTIAILTRMLGLSKRAALFSALLYAGLPVGLMAIWWGFTAQIFGQALMVPLAIALLYALRHSSTSAWGIAETILCIALLTHIGVAIIAVVWLNIFWLLLRWKHPANPERWHRLGEILIISCLISAILIYSSVAPLMIEESLKVGKMLLSNNPSRIFFAPIVQAFVWSLNLLGVILLLPGFLLVRHRRLPPGGKELLDSWVGVVLLFLIIELATDLQVRYIFFLAPLACIGWGWMLDRLAHRTSLAHLVVWIVLGVLVLPGVIFWYTAVFAGKPMPINPFLRL